MKRCPNCNQVFKDEYSYCLTDGTTLVQEDFLTETPTVVRPVHSETAAKKGANPLVYVAVAAVVLLLFGGAIAAFVLYNMNKSDDPAPNANVSKGNLSSEKENSKSENKADDDETDARKKELDEREEELKREEERLKTEKEKLKEQKEKPKTEPAVNPPTQSSTQTALVFAPPSNVRSAPNGAVQCVVRRREYIVILGSTGVRDNNGVWYYTNACGRTGVIHSTQIRF